MKYGAPAEVANALADFGLISDEQADEAFSFYWDREQRLHDDAVWWVRLAILAWKNETPWYKRWLNFGQPRQSWARSWIEQRRW